jgi:hypothetical protein
MNKKFVYHVGNNKKAILWCAANQISTNSVLSSRWPEGTVKCFGHFSRSKRFPFLLHSTVVTLYASETRKAFMNSSPHFIELPSSYYVCDWYNLWIRSVHIHCRHRSCMTRSETHWYRVVNKDFAPIYLWLSVLRQLWCDNAAHAPNTCTNSCNESSGRTVGIAASYYFHLCNEINKCICMKYVSSRY